MPKKRLSFVQRIKTGLSCFVCGISNPILLDFHHVDPSAKSGNISELKAHDIIASEVKKCLPICANCHRKLHARF